MIIAKLHDGRELCFPDETPDPVIDSTVLAFVKKKLPAYGEFTYH
jgi:hypothetical protein